MTSPLKWSHHVSCMNDLLVYVSKNKKKENMFDNQKTKNMVFSNRWFKK